MTDWRRLFEEWDKVPEDVKRRIFEVFLTKTPDQLRTFFLREPYAHSVWRKIPEERRFPPPPPVALSKFPEQIKLLRERLTRQSHSQFFSQGLGEEDWLAHRANVATIIHTAFLMFGDLPKEEAERSIIERVDREVEKLIREIKKIPVAPPPIAPPPRVEEVGIPAATYLGPRRRRLETFTCFKPDCWETVTVDRDLEYRVRLVPVLKADSPKTGPRFEPLLRFPPKFYFLCPKHRKERYGYTGIYDALAFLLRETEIGVRLTVTKATFREVGLDAEDMGEIQKQKAKYLPTYS